MKTLFSFAALAVTALALQAQNAQAQTTTSGSTSTSSSGSTSASGSFSGSSTTSGTSANQQRQNTRQNATTNNNTNVPITFNSADPAGANGAPGATNAANGSNTPGGSSGQPYYGQSDITVRTTPTVYAPPVQGGNPCTVGVSGGLSVVGWGAALGGTWVDEDCANRQKIAMIHNAGYAQAARELMCNDRATYIAFRGTNTPCNARPAFDGPGAPQPIVQQQPTPIAPPPQQMVTKDRTTLPRCSRTITDNCWGG